MFSIWKLPNEISPRKLRLSFLQSPQRYPFLQTPSLFTLFLGLTLLLLLVAGAKLDVSPVSATEQSQMEEPTPTSRAAPGRSCMACRKRKIKCDREQPCSYCIKLRLQCVYTDLNRTEKGRPVDDLGSRLKRIEMMLERLEQKVTSTANPQPIENDVSRNYDPEEDSSKSSPRNATGSGKLVLGEGDVRYINSSFWPELDEGDREDIAIAEQSSVGAALFPGHQNFVMDSSTAPEDLQQLHPTGDYIFTLWQIFLENVDPILKLIHVPLTQRQLLWASQNLTRIPPAFESLMFSIYFAAVTSTQSPASHPKNFRVDRQTSLNQYKSGLEAALAKAKFMSRPDVTTVQALTLYLVCARLSADKAYVWSMVGLLIRLAMQLGLHRDPEELGLPPFMSEMRRRLWWQICILDVRTAEDYDTDPFICEHIFNTKFPTNVNDMDLDVHMTRPVTDVQHRTEMLFTLVRFEISYTARKVVFSSKFAADNGYPRLSLEQKNEMLDHLLIKLQEKYLKYCDSKVPICALTETASRMVITKMKLTINHPTRRESSGISKGILQDLVLRSIEIIEKAHNIRATDKYSHWAWLFEKYVEWDAVAFLLQSLSVVSLSLHLERAWNAIDLFFNDWGEQTVDSDRWRRLKNLQKKAAARQGRQISSSFNPAKVTPTATVLEPTFRDIAATNPAEFDTAKPSLDSTTLLNSVSGFQPIHPHAVSHGMFAPIVAAGHIDWQFDDFSLLQGVPNWEMELDENEVALLGVE
jgi:hypothetical protein